MSRSRYRLSRELTGRSDSHVGQADYLPTHRSLAQDPSITFIDIAHMSVVASVPPSRSRRPAALQSQVGRDRGSDHG